MEKDTTNVTIKKVENKYLCSFMFSLVTSSKLIIFALFYNIVTCNSLTFMYYVFACFICICFYIIDCLDSFFIVSPNEIL